MAQETPALWMQGIEISVMPWGSCGGHWWMADKLDSWVKLSLAGDGVSMLNLTSLGCKMCNGRQWEDEESLKVEKSGFLLFCISLVGQLWVFLTLN